MNEDKRGKINLPPAGIELPVDPETEEKEASRLRMYQYVASRYSRVSQPDKDLLSELVVKAKGPARTMKEFAEEIGTAPSTLSRLVNKQNRGPNSDELIIDIATHADPKSGVTLERLLGAHGMAEIIRPETPEKDFAKEAKKIIVSELYDRGYSIVNASGYEGMRRKIGLDVDFALKTDALQAGGGFWYFETVYINSERRYSQSRRFTNVERHLSQAMTDYYIGDCPYDRVSVVVDSEEVFIDAKNRMLNRLGEIKIKDSISIILLDMENGSVSEEFVIPSMKETREDVFYRLEEKEDEPTMGLSSGQNPRCDAPAT